MDSSSFANNNSRTLGSPLTGSPLLDKSKVDPESLVVKPLSEFFEQFTANFDRKGNQEILQSTKKQTVGIFIDKKSKKRVVAKQLEFQDEKPFEATKRHILSLQGCNKFLGYHRIYAGKETRVNRLKKTETYIIIAVQERLRSL